jgi:hypothetical protein
VLAAGVPASWLAEPDGVAIRRLATPWGELSYRLARRPAADGGGVRYRLEPSSGEGLAAPPGGLVFTWPLAGAPGGARVDGRPVALDGEGGPGVPAVTVHGVPATVDLLPPAVPAVPAVPARGGEAP